MRSSSRGIVVAATLVGAVVSISHAKGTRTPAAGSADPAPPADDDDDEIGAGSGSALAAPKDAAARGPWLVERFTKAVSPKLHAKLAYVAVDLTTGTELVARDADRGMNLASNAKLLTSIAALHALGGGFRWRTAVVAAAGPDASGTIAGDLYLRGRGDPLLSVEALDALAEDVAARGVKTVEGRLVIDASYFDDKYEPPHFGEQPWEQSGFRAPVAALTVARGAVTVVVIADPGGGAHVSVSPVVDYVKIVKDEVTSARTGGTRLRVEAKMKPDRVEIEASGVIRQGEGSWDLRKRVDDPARLAAEVFKKALAAHGIRVAKGIATGVAPLGAKPIAAHESATLADTLRMMNKHSDNTVAETVLKTLGAEAKKGAGPATWADGQAALVAELNKLGLTGQFRSENGSGLFAASEVSARQLVRLLVAAHKDYRIGPDLVASLPVGGVDGTLAKRFKGHLAQGRVRAKTGTLDKVSSLSGYVAVDGGHPIAFAILANDIAPGHGGLVKSAADEMVDSLAAYLGAR